MVFIQRYTKLALVSSIELTYNLLDIFAPNDL
jgi:hypothetical protein